MVPAVRREHHRCVVIPAQAIGLGGRIGIPFPGLQARFILLSMSQSLSCVLILARGAPPKAQLIRSIGPSALTLDPVTATQADGLG